MQPRYYVPYQSHDLHGPSALVRQMGRALYLSAFQYDPPPMRWHSIRPAATSKMKGN